jgi:methionyl-tRNA formyltransferase
MTIVLVGSGQEMICYSELIREKRRNVVFLATSRETYNEVNKKHHLNLATNLISNDLELRREIRNLENIEYILCFGIRWIISNRTLLLADRWYNLNMIPIPKYLGGAHISWQILHSENIGAIVVQKLTARVDRGDIIFYRRFKYSENVRIPKDYFLENVQSFAKNVETISHILDSPKENIVKVDWSKSEYWPRLYTNVSGWLDWEMSGGDIEKFILAFSSPYSGALTKIGRKTRSLTNARFYPSKHRHSFDSGLVIRVDESKNQVFFATKDGTIQAHVEKLESAPIRTGLRAYSPPRKIRKARTLRINAKFLRKKSKFERFWKVL